VDKVEEYLHMRAGLDRVDTVFESRHGPAPACLSLPLQLLWSGLVKHKKGG
jgi:hypothetical protein